MAYLRKYKHEISFDGVNFNPVKLSIEVNFTDEREKDQVFYRRVSSIWKLNFYRNKSVYYSLLNYIHFPETLTTECLCRTWRADDGVNFNKVYFTGYFDLSSAKVNQDDGSIEFTPGLFDDYVWWDEHKDEKINIKDTSSIISPLAPKYRWSSTPYYLWQINDPDHGNSSKGAGGYAHSLLAPFDWAPGKTYRPLDTEQGWVTYNGDKYRCKKHHLSSQSNAPALGSEYWDYVEDCIGYIQQQSYLMITGSALVQGNNIWDTGFPNITARVSGATNCPSYLYYAAQKDTIIGEFELPQIGYKVFDILNELILMAGVGLTVESEFFTAGINPVTGKTNRLTNLMLLYKKQYKARIADPENVEGDGVAIDAQITFKELFDFFLTVFDVRWCMIGKKLKLEHISYFDNGYSYSGNASVGTDLMNTTKYPLKWCIMRDINHNGRFNKYSFVIDGIPPREVWNWQEGEETTGTIEYLSRLCKKNDPVEHKADNYMVDLDMCIKKTEEIQDTGWLLLACDSDNYVWKRDISFSSLFPGKLNGDLFWENLIPDFHAHHRFFPQGRYNGGIHQLQSICRVRRQENVKWPRLEEVDPTKLINTSLGAGEVEKLELSTDTDFYTATLRFDFDISGGYTGLITVDSTKIYVSSTGIRVSQIHELTD